MAQNILSSLSFEEKLYLYLLKVNQLWWCTFDLSYKLLLWICETNELLFWTEFVPYRDVVQANIDEQLKELKS
jgi:hypothetical protein